MPPPLIGGGIKRCFCLTSVCLSRTSGVTREQRPRKTKIGTEVDHVTRDSDTTFKVKRSEVKVTRPLWLVVLAGQYGHSSGDLSICVHDVYRPGWGNIVAAARLQLVLNTNLASSLDS